MTSSAASWEYGARSAWPATILSATYTSCGFSTITFILHSRIANCECGFLPQPLEQHRERMQLVHVVGRGIAGVAQQEELAGACLAELLRPHGDPLQHRAAPQTELRHQVVRGLGGAGVRAGENFR